MSGLLIVGDLLFDREIIGTVDRLCPEAPVPVLVESSVVDRPGGAGLAALFAAADARELGGTGDPVTMVAAVSDDEAGERLRELLAGAGVRLVPVPLLGPTPEKIRMRSGGHLLLRLDRGDDPTPIGPVPGEAVEAVHDADAILVSDYGRGMSGMQGLRAALGEAATRVPVVWDPHPRGGRPVAGAALVTPNRSEAAGFSGRPAPRDGPDPVLTAARADAEALRTRWSVGAVTVTIGERGAVLADGVRAPLLIPPPCVAHGDPCGAGDRFASAALAALAAGKSTEDAVSAAVDAASGYVQRGGALALPGQDALGQEAKG